MGEDVEESKPENSEAVNYHLTDSELKRYCDNARAYGWEAGRIFGAVDRSARLEAVYTTTPNNPFTDPNWDAELKNVTGFMVTATENQL